MKWSLAPHWPGRLRRRGPLQGLAAGALLLGLVAGMAPRAPAASAADDDSPDADPPWRTVYALTSASQIVGFDPLRPERVRFQVAVTNLKAGERLVGIDFRPLTGRLYGVGSTSQVYTINLRNGFAAPIGAPFTPGLDGAENGVDFNPQADRLRVVSKAGQNLRLNPDTGAAAGNAADGPLAYATQPPADANAGKQPGVTGAAYTNNFAGTTATTLYDVDTTQDVLAIQNPPNDGTLRTVGALGVDFGDATAFDIASGDSRLTRVLRRRFGPRGDEREMSDTALAVSQVAGSGPSRLFSIDLKTGKATERGTVGGGEVIRGLAIPTAEPDLQEAYLLTPDNQLLGFDPLRPQRIRSRVAVSGLQAGERLVGIDFRPATGRLYGVGSTSRVYTIDTTTGAAVQIGAAPFTPGLDGAENGVDFNPQADRLRVVSKAGQNLRLNPDTGAAAGNAADGPLAYATQPPADANAGKQPGVTGAAYTNNVARATSTVLYDVDTTQDVLAIQNPPNDGTLRTVGALGVDFGDATAFDIASGDSRLTRVLRRRFGPRGDEREMSDTALAVSQVAGSGPSRLFSIDLKTGKATERGTVGGGEVIRGLAIPTAEPDLQEAYLLTPDNQLLGFDPLRPQRIRSRVAVSGLQAGERLVGIDFRPATGRLYGVGSTSRVYTIDTTTGAAVQIGAAPFTPGLDGAENGVDFNPQADRLRVVSKAGQNLRLNPDTGAAAGNAADGPLAYAAQPPADANAGKQPGVTGAAYTNNFAGTTATTLYDVDTTQDVLAIQNPPNDGTLRTVGSLQQDAGDLLGFDIVSLAGGNRLAEQLSRRLAGGAPDAGLAVFQPAGSQQLRLYSVDLGSGRVRDRGSFPDGVAARGLAIALDAPERPDND